MVMIYSVAGLHSYILHENYLNSHGKCFLHQEDNFWEICADLTSLFE